MKKAAIFIFVFTFLVLVFTVLFKDSYMDASLSAFGKIKSSLGNAASGFDGLLHGRKLKEENEALKKELSRITARDAQNQQLTEENNNLRAALEMRQRSEYENQVYTSVIAVNTRGEFTLTLDKGKKHGISQGSVALWGEALAGRVTRVFDDYSIVIPITAPESSTGIKNSSSDAGMVRGSNALFQKNMCELTFFAQTEENTDGVIMTSGLSDIYPPDLIIGKTEDNKTVKTEIDFFKIRTLCVVIP